jgi:hypothetical protein
MIEILTLTRPARPAPPAPIASPSAGSESDDEMPQTSMGTELPLRGAPPPIPSRDGPSSPIAEPRSPPARPSMDREPTSPTSPSDKRSQRLPPAVPISSPTMAPAGQTRPPPPPPPTQAPPTRQATTDSLHKRAVGVGASGGGESEYEGDYDTDITSNAKHKDALKAHARESSLDDSTAAEDTLVRSPSMSASGFGTQPRTVPPPIPPTQPPPQAGRKSVDTPRAAPPPVPLGGMEDDDEYDPYKYVPGSSATPRAPPPAPRQAPQLPSMPPPPPVPATQQRPEDSEDDDLYTEPAPRKSTEQPRKSMDRPPPPLPPQGPPQHDRAPPPLPPQAPPSHTQYDAPPPAPPSGRAPPRPSVDQERSYPLPPRMSMDPQMPRTSTSGHRPDGDFIARDVDLAYSSRWWMQPNVPPPVFQGRPDVSYEVREANPKSKSVYVLYQDYSQTIITAQYDPRNPDNVSLDQQHEGPPSKLRQDQLEGFWTRYGSLIAKGLQSTSGSAAVGDGSSYSLVLELLKPLKGALSPVGTRAFGAMVYANLGNATVQQFDEIRPGDVVSFRNTKFSGKHGNLHTKYSVDLANHVGVVVEWDGTKRKLRVAEQGKDGHGEAVEGGKAPKEKSKKKGKVEVESYRLGDLRSGEVRVWRVVSRGYVGWSEQ